MEKEKHDHYKLMNEKNFKEILIVQDGDGDEYVQWLSLDDEYFICSRGKIFGPFNIEELLEKLGD